MPLFAPRSITTLTTINTVAIFLIAGFASAPLIAKTAKPVRATFASTEEAFIAAKEANGALDMERFIAASSAAQQSSTSSPSSAAVAKLTPYLDYWKLRIPLAQARSDSRAPLAPEVLSAVESETRVFLGKHAGTIYADLLRRDWLYVLAKRGDWAAFDAQYPLWALRDEPLLHCWAGLSKVTQDPASAAKVKQEFSDALNEVKDIGDSGNAFKRAWTLVILTAQNESRHFSLQRLLSRQ
jgi:hypothetical protein